MVVNGALSARWFSPATFRLSFTFIALQKLWFAEVYYKRMEKEKMGNLFLRKSSNFTTSNETNFQIRLFDLLSSLRVRKNTLSREWWQIVATVNGTQQDPPMWWTIGIYDSKPTQQTRADAIGTEWKKQRKLKTKKKKRCPEKIQQRVNSENAERKKNRKDEFSEFFYPPVFVINCPVSSLYGKSHIGSILYSLYENRRNER